MRRLLLILAALGLLCAPATILAGPYDQWGHNGSLYIITTPEGANLPTSAVVNDFPLLVRLDKEFFKFEEAQAQGQDIRFATVDGQPLKYQIEQWIAQPMSADEMPESGPFYARDDTNQGTLVCAGTLTEPADFAFVRVMADGQPYGIWTGKRARWRREVFLETNYY